MQEIKNEEKDYLNLKINELLIEKLGINIK
jgi:hypothetical protein